MPVEPAPPPHSRHNNLRDLIARDWQTALRNGARPVLSMRCECGNTLKLPEGGVTVETEYAWDGNRPDIAILNASSLPCFFGEIIDKGPPSKDLLRKYQVSTIPVVFIPYSDARDLRGFCSVRCWDDRREVKAAHDSRPYDPYMEDSRDEVLLWCDTCNVRLTEREAIGDCSGVSCPKCVGENIIALCCWGRDPSR